MEGRACRDARKERLMTKNRTTAVCLLAAGLLALAPLSAHAAPLAPAQGGMWSWIFELPSVVTAGWNSIWQREGSFPDPDGQPVPEGSSIDPDGQPAPGAAVIQPEGSSIDPAGQPVPPGAGAGTGDIGHLSLIHI